MRNLFFILLLLISTAINYKDSTNTGVKRKTIFKVISNVNESKPCKLAFNMKEYFKYSTLTVQELDTLINICKKECDFMDYNIVLVTIYRESSFNHLAKRKPTKKERELGIIPTDKGLGQFVKICCKYHKVDYDSLFDYKYATRAIIKRYKDINKQFKTKDKKSLVVAYGCYDRLRRPEKYSNIIKEKYSLYLKKEKLFTKNCLYEKQ